jgi:DNA-binding CsgD family transcriptional regulator
MTNGAVVRVRRPTTKAERDRIVHLWTDGRPVWEIAFRLRRHPSTVRHVVNRHLGKPSALSKTLTPRERNSGRETVCLSCGHGRLECHTDGSGCAYEECRFCGWSRYFGRVRGPTTVPYK